MGLTVVIHIAIVCDEHVEPTVFRDAVVFDGVVDAIPCVVFVQMLIHTEVSASVAHCGVSAIVVAFSEEEVGVSVVDIHCAACFEQLVFAAVDRFLPFVSE